MRYTLKKEHQGLSNLLPSLKEVEGGHKVKYNSCEFKDRE